MKKNITDNGAQFRNKKWIKEFTLYCFGKKKQRPIETVIVFTEEKEIELELIIEIAMENLFRKADTRHQRVVAGRQSTRYVEVLLKTHQESSVIHKVVSKL